MGGRGVEETTKKSSAVSREPRPLKTSSSRDPPEHERKVLAAEKNANAATASRRSPSGRMDGRLNRRKEAIRRATS